MYKLLMVEDEEDVREGLVEEIEWESYGFQVVEQAENGREAAELIDKCMPDIVVTDIQMPFMDGLQLAGWIREHYPTTKIIILTGYDEFEYAQKAIKLQIDGYVLKPFSSMDLIEILLKVKNQMDAERAEKENVHTLMEHYRKSIPVLRELFLSSLVTRKISPQEIHEKSISYGLELTGQAFMVSVIRIDYVHEHQQVEKRLLEPQNSHSLKYTDDRHLQLLAVLNVAEELCRKQDGIKVFIHNDDVVLLSIEQEADEEVISGRTLQLLEEIRQNVQKYLKLTVTSGSGYVYQELGLVHESYQDALLALDYRLILGNNRVLWINDVEVRRYYTLCFDELREKAFVRTIKVGTEEELNGMMEELFGELNRLELSVQDCQIYMLEILTSLMKVAKESGIELDEILGSTGHPIFNLYKYNNLDEVIYWLKTLSTKLMRTIAAGRQSGVSQLVEEAKVYIHEHFRDSDISISKVCKHLHISAGYFSSIFKKEVKMTFVNYLMYIRMEQAKELLRSSDLKTFQIAESVGFADPNYFSFCFRKKFGISPKEYRNGAKGGEMIES